MTSTTLLLIRHGQTDWNLERRYQGQKDIPLNATGTVQARHAAKALRLETFDGIIASDQLRALRTAEIIAESHGLPVETDVRLREISFGKWEGMTWSEIEQAYPGEAVAWRQNTLPAPPGGESFVEMGLRTGAFLESMRGIGGRYAVVAHGGSLRSIVAGCLGLAPEKSWQFQIKNLSISELALYDNATVLNRWNDTQHLEERQDIRPISLAIIEHQDHILVAEFTEPTTGKLLYRPLGGGIEFGETGEQALVREIGEELQAYINQVEYWKMVENIFTYDGNPGHEIVQLYRAKFVDPRCYDFDSPSFVFEEGVKAVWKRIADFDSADSPLLYPDGLLELLRQ